jgi:hypothetical protein
MLSVETVRLLLIFYVMASPFVFVVLQQTLFKEKFDDDFGSRVIMRLHLITTAGCLGFFLMTLDWGKWLLTK